MSENPTVENPASPSSAEDDELLTSEKWWRDRYGMLEKRGYLLRPRYRPDWIPSWKKTGKNPLFYEDHICNTRGVVMDATRVKDGTVVSIKRIKRNPEEISIALFLSPTDESIPDPKNHCVHILDHFSDDSVPSFSFLVMPLLRRFNHPPFHAAEEVVEFVKQTLEGLSYMHSRGVAHRDCAAFNIMLDGSPLYPQGFHPVVKSMDPSGLKIAPHLRRRDVQGVKYYFIDFGISTRFEQNVKQEDRLVTGINGRDRDVPELSDEVSYDPFAVDVFILGNLYRKTFLDVYTNLAFLSNLIQAMTASHPSERPSPDEALEQFNKLVTVLPSYRLRWRLKQKDSGFVRRVLVDIDSAAHEGLHITKKLIGFRPISVKS